MKHLIFLAVLMGFIACTDDFTDTITPIGIIVDTVYVCPPEEHPDDIAYVNLYRTYAENSRACKWVYRIPDIPNAFGNTDNIINCPIIFNDDCDSTYAEVLQFQNVGDTVVFSPERPKLIGNIYYEIDSVATEYAHFIPGFQRPLYGAIAPPDSMLYISYRSCTFPMIIEAQSGFAVKGNKLILIQ